MAIKRVIPGIIILLFLLNYHGLAQQIQLDQTNETDLQLTECSFEKDAKAMVLTDVADMEATGNTVTMTRHKRIKLFKNYDPDLVTIHLRYLGRLEDIDNIEAKTLRWQNGQVITTLIEPKLIYKNNLDKDIKELVFTFPAVEPGCIIDYKYRWRSYSQYDIPDWNFQSIIPVAYSRLNLTITGNVGYNMVEKGNQPFSLKTTEPADHSGIVYGTTYT
jgi:hypothetical protein